MRYKIVVSVIVLLALFSVLGFSENMMDRPQTNVSFSAEDGTELTGYLSVPAGNGPFPGVLMVHEWWGLNKDIARLADALSKEGYAVLAADAFRGSIASTPAEAIQQIRNTPQQQIASDLDAALDFLKSHSKVDADRVASLGFCFGGTQAMRMGTRRPDLGAVVIFYGGSPLQDPQELGSMKDAGPVLGIYGEEDSSIPLDRLNAFESALQTREVEYTITVYPGVGHAFIDSENYNEEETASKAWNQMVDFLDKTIGE